MSRARHKKSSGGGITMNGGTEDGGGNPAVMKEAKERKKGGKVKMSGAKAKHRLDRPGRKTGGRVGADRSPLSSAHSMAGGAKTDTGGPYEAPK